MNKIVTLLIGYCLLASCVKKAALEDPIPATDVNIIIQETNVSNVYRFINASIGKTATAYWDLGNNETARGDTVIGKYPFKGTYNVSLTVFNGITAVKKTSLLTVQQDNVSLDTFYIHLTGGPDSLAGKTWVLDSLTNGHIKLINSGSTTVINALGKAGKGVYDDELTFRLTGKECVYNNHGTSYCHGGTIDGVTQFRFKELGQLWGTASNPVADGGDLTINYTPAQPTQHWTMSIRNGKHYLQLYDGAFFFFYRGCAALIEYEITSISKNEMVVTHYETEPASRANALWRDTYILLRKGYVR